MTDHIALDFSCSIDGKTWKLYRVEFVTAEGKFATYIYAISFEHAAAVVEELKQTAILDGEVSGVVTND